MIVGDVIRCAQSQGRTHIGIDIKSIHVLAKDKIKVIFFDNLNMGIELEGNHQLYRILIFDARSSDMDPVGMLFKHPATNKFRYAEKFPGVKLIDRIAAVRDQFASMAHDADFIAVAKNLAKLFGPQS